VVLLANALNAGPLDQLLWLPSGYVKIAIENGHRNSGFSH